MNSRVVDRAVCKIDSSSVEFANKPIDTVGGLMRIKEKPTSIGDKKDLAKPAVDFWMSLDGGKVAKLGRKDADTLGVKTWPNKKSIPLN
ncbi:hypothetical protein PCC21_016290 [Pectobacterium carotovorum subsp. carotovorum PCC21]|nr:hypothetical protein PCC21_016290 [Pectobacterium carotovorum subsp. carotovorum PCC21]